MRSILSSRNSYTPWSGVLGFITIMGFILLCILVFLVATGRAETVPSATAPGEVTQLSDITTIWSLTKLGGGISLAIFGVFAFGIFLIVYQLYELITDKLRSRDLLSRDYRQLSLGDARNLVMRNPNNVPARLYSILLTVFHSTGGNTQDFHNEIANFIQMQQDRFGTFKNRLAFLSDTAGALGLLGTVWGMFITFFGGNLDSQRILNGMGLALVTTLIGLVVSVILNLCSTEVFSIFNKRLELISAKADEFRLRLMALANQRQRRAGDPNSSGGSQAVPENRQRVSAQPQGKQQTSLLAMSLKPLTDLQLDGWIGQRLAKPIAIQVETECGQRVSGVPIQFEIADGGGFVEEDKKVAWVKTDNKGVARVHWTLGHQVGPQRMKVYLPNHQGRYLEFVTFAQPQLPNEPESLAAHQVEQNRKTVN